MAHAYYAFDGNGNATAPVNISNVVVAQYAYDPFGNLLAKLGPLADANVYRFSSKEYHANSGLCYYGFRFYDPNLQRWLNRDPMEEAGGLNLFSFSQNGPLNILDPFGLEGVGADSVSQTACQPNGAGQLAREYLKEVAESRAADKLRREAVEEALKQFRSSPGKARKALARVIAKGDGPAHHLATLESRAHPFAERAAQGGFNWNGANNGVRLPQALHKGFQQWHRNWNQWLKDYFDLMMRERPDIAAEEAAAELQKVVDLERARLIQCAASGTMP
jgi:RHS repeat-associated protein